MTDLDTLLALVADPARVATVPTENIPALRVAARALHRDLGAIEHALDARWTADECQCFDVHEVARRLKCSVDLVRERGETWGIAKVLARDARGRPSRVTYPRVLLDRYLHMTGQTSSPA
jgi:hypothetical protein